MTEQASIPSPQFSKFTGVCADAADLIVAVQSLAGLISMNQDANKPVQSAANSINALCDRIEDCLGSMTELAEKIDLERQGHISSVEIDQ